MARVTMLCHAPGRRDRPAAAQGVETRCPPHRVRAGYRSPRRIRGPTGLDEVRPLTVSTARRQDPRGQAVERVRRPVPLSRATGPWSARRCATPSTTAMAFPSPCSASSTAAWKLAPKGPASSGGPRNCAGRTCPWSSTTPGFPDPALDPDPQPRVPHPLPDLRAPARGMGRPLQHHPGADRDLRRDPAPCRHRLPGVGLGQCGNDTGARAL